MALNFIGGVWKKMFKADRKGFSWQLKAEVVEKWLKDNPNEEYIRGLGFDNSDYKADNPKAPDYSLALVEEDEGSDRGRRGGRSSSRGEDRRSEQRKTQDEPRKVADELSGRRRSAPKQDEGTDEVPF